MRKGIVHRRCTQAITMNRKRKKPQECRELRTHNVNSKSVDMSQMSTSIVDRIVVAYLRMT